jgi:hypothetical protein
MGDDHPGLFRGGLSCLPSTGHDPSPDRLTPRLELALGLRTSPPNLGGRSLSGAGLAQPRRGGLLASSLGHDHRADDTIA